jgi:hypothetical protein
MPTLLLEVTCHGAPVRWRAACRVDEICACPIGCGRSVSTAHARRRRATAPEAAGRGGIGGTVVVKKVDGQLARPLL